MGKKEKEVKVVEEVKSYSSIDIHIEKLIACGTNAEIKQEITRFKEEKAK